MIFIKHKNDDVDYDIFNKYKVEDKWIFEDLKACKLLLDGKQINELKKEHTNIYSEILAIYNTFIKNNSISSQEINNEEPKETASFYVNIEKDNTSISIIYVNEKEKEDFIALLTTIYTDKWRVLIPGWIHSLLWNQIRNYLYSDKICEENKNLSCEEVFNILIKIIDSSKYIN